MLQGRLHNAGTTRVAVSDMSEMRLQLGQKLTVQMSGGHPLSSRCIVSLSPRPMANKLSILYKISSTFEISSTHSSIRPDTINFKRPCARQCSSPPAPYGRKWSFEGTEPEYVLNFRNFHIPFQGIVV